MVEVLDDMVKFINQVWLLNNYSPISDNLKALSYHQVEVSVRLDKSDNLLDLLKSLLILSDLDSVRINELYEV